MPTRGPRRSSSSTTTDPVPGGGDHQTYAGIVILLIALPMAAAMTAVVTLAILGRRLEFELVELRRSLRLVGAAAIAADELRRAGTAVALQATSAAAQVRLRVGWPRTVRRRHAR